MYELNKEFKEHYEWVETFNCGRWKKTGYYINFSNFQSHIISTTWKNSYHSGIGCFSFVNAKYSEDRMISPRYFTTLIESDLSDSEKSRMLIKRGFY